MGYFKAYWQQVTALYKQLWQLTFQKQRNLEGPLSDFVPGPGLFWQLVQLHWFALVAIGRLLSASVAIVLGYATFLLLMLFFLVLPGLLALIFPIFTVNRYRKLRKKGELL